MEGRIALRSQTEIRRRLTLDRCIANLARDHPEVAQAPVPGGITAFWGESFGWPEWMLEGTGFSNTTQTPTNLRMIDDLRIIANLLVHVGEVELARMMLSWQRFPGDGKALCAPDLDSALALIVPQTNMRNPAFDLELDRKGDRAIVRIVLNPEIAAFHALFEQTIVIWLYRIFRSFLDMSDPGRKHLGMVAIGRVHSDSELDASFSCAIERVKTTPFVSLPMAALTCHNPGFDPELWGQVQTTAATSGVFEEATEPGAREPIAERVQDFIWQHGRIPQFGEIAASLRMSERTLARRLAQSGLSYREITAQVRMAIAQDLLKDRARTLDSIGEQLGYSDVSAFVRAFRRRFGTSPGKWRMGQVAAFTHD